jgi:uncharacterized protein
MKPSFYNHFFEIGDGRIVLAYNSYSGSLAEIGKENFPRVQQLLADPGSAAAPGDEEFLRCLKAGRFLIPDMVDQTATLKTITRSGRLEGTVLTLTIAPSLSCNFDCPYCFESRSNLRMSESTQEALVRFADHHLKRSRVLRVCWFGGEPTLCFSIIRRLQGQLLESAEKHRARAIPGAIITNGYLLDGVMAEQLKEMRISQAQVTIDGPAAVHDSRRRLRNGRGTFSRIIENLSETAAILSITVRINVDKDNVDSAYEVVEILQQKDILSKVKVTFAQVRSTANVCSDIRDRCYDPRGFARTLLEIHKRLLSRGINRVDLPRPLGGASCGALAEGYYVVSPTGHLFRCWEELSLDAEKSTGDLYSFAPTPEQRQNLEMYRSWNPFRLKDCRDCIILPICMGGCPLSGIRSESESTGVCTSWKYNLKEMLELAYTATMQHAPGKTG